MYAKDAAPTEVLPLYGRLSVGRAAPGLRAVDGRGRPPPRDPRDERRRDEPDRARHPLRRSTPAPRASRATASAPRSSGCRSRRSRRRRRSSARAARGARAPASRSASTPRTTSSGAPSSPSRRSCARASPRSSCRCSSLGFGDITAFPFLTPPDSRGVKARSTCCSNSARRSHPHGAARSGRRRRTSSPPRPRDRPACRSTRASRACSSRRRRTASRATCSRSSPGSSIQDLRERPRGARGGRPPARPVHRPDERLPHAAEPLEPPAGAAGELSGSAFRRLCRAEHLNYVRVREWVDVHRQLRALASRSACTCPARRASRTPTTSTARSSPDCSRTSASSTSAKTSSGRAARAPPARANARAGAAADYLGARGARFAIFPGSGLAKKRPSA